MREWVVVNPKDSGYSLELVTISELGDTRVVAVVRPGRSYTVPGAQDLCVRRVKTPARILISSEGEILPDTLPPSRAMKRMN